MYIEKLDITKVKHIDLLSELALYEKLNVVKTDEAFMGYAMSYKVELVEKNDPSIQLEARKSTIIDLFNDLLEQKKISNIK